MPSNAGMPTVEIRNAVMVAAEVEAEVEVEVEAEVGIRFGVLFIGIQSKCWGCAIDNQVYPTTSSDM